VGLSYLHTSLDQFTETGAGIEDLVVKGDADSLQSALGVRLSTRYRLANGATLTPELRAAWQHEFLDQEQKITSAFAANPGGTFSIEGARFSRESAIVGIGLTYAMSPQTKIFADYDFKWNGDYTAHQVSAGIRFSFGAPAPLPPAPVAAPPPPQPAPPVAAAPPVFVVYFDFDRSTLTPEAVGIIRQAADAFRRTGAVTIRIDGYTDLAGTAKYNIGLSKRRADAVRAELVKDGVAGNAVAEAWHGKSDPAVPTPDGVREPRNRRVTLALP
jgi:outer membrane protein OmpA-like peptidoglycan-associated protein